MNKFLSVFLLLLLMTSCSHSKVDSNDSSAKYIFGTPPLFANGAIKDGCGLEFDYIKDVVLQYSKPKSIKSKEVTNRHNKSTDKVISYKWEGLLVKTYYVTDQKKEMISYVVVSDNKYVKNHWLNIGISKDVIVKRLGKPDKVSKTNNNIRLRYESEDEDGLTDVLDVLLLDNNVQSVECTAGID